MYINSQPLPLFSIELGVASRTWKNRNTSVKEMMSSSLLALGAIGVSAYVSKGLPRISEITTVASGASMIAAAMGYDTAAFNSLVLAPITFAYMAMIPSAIYDFNNHWNSKLAIPFTVLGVLGRPFANSALTVLTSRSGYTGLIKAGTTFTVMMCMWANTSLVLSLGIELKRPSNVRALNRNRIRSFSCALVAGLAQVGALCSGRPLISGTLCMTSVASQLLSEHYTRNQRRAWRQQQGLTSSTETS